MEQQQNSPGFRNRYAEMNFNIERYKVIMHNDDVTTMDFVVMVLTDVFYKTEEEAERLMLEKRSRKFGVFCCCSMLQSLRWIKAKKAALSGR